ncbi:periplasmic chaperone for outer membrane proteins Skp [Prosthecobacter fusiformis]|uniref:Periplasmic chaperone for outer membrane proteins Skp n=1 Tax=Prosthecobacter fusiformis TaxID=48464 RepID=A0A4R7RZU1_9BACT|nr:OmpH family outer membrane protein [Prosthecobacter fusiformis]TDU70676.1 periplasmic chaperone for outer membrane proteins Skp [Prosthecobacter fusiformis]
MIRLLTLALLTTSLTLASAADLKFGVVDMSKAFSEFHKTKKAAEDFKGNVDKAQKEMNDRWAVYKNLMNDMQKLKKEASDPIMTPDARAKKAAEFEEKGKELRTLEQEIGEQQNRRSSQLKQEDVQIRRGIYDEILVVVRDKAKVEGYDFIFDKSGMSLSTVPVLIYYKDAVDITDQIVVELNKAAEASPAPAAPAATE